MPFSRLIEIPAMATFTKPKLKVTTVTCLFCVTLCACVFVCTCDSQINLSRKQILSENGGSLLMLFS